MITKLVIFDFDGTISNSPKPEDGIEQWEKVKGVKFTHDDWWGRPESLDTKVFDFKFFPKVVNILNKEKSNPNTLVMILSSRIEKLRPYIKNILKQNNVSVKLLELKTDERTKGEKVLDFINKFPTIKQVDVYDDRNKEIKTYLSIINDIPDNVVFNIYVVTNGNIVKYNNDSQIINENMSPITLRYKPQFLPQVSAPYTEVVNNLASDGVGHEVMSIDPNELKPIQGITLSHNVEKVNLDDEKPIWISKDMEVLDGLHRMTKAIFQNRPIRCVKIDLNSKDACRVLNKIQDLYDHKKEVETDKENNMEFLEKIDKPNIDPEIKEEPVKIIAYRKEKINPKSVIGNFFSLKPLNGANKYEIEFDNLLDVKSLGLNFMDGQNPVDMLAKTWFPHVNFEKLAEENATDSMKLKNRAVADKARKMGFDGIQYSDRLIQGL